MEDIDKLRESLRRPKRKLACYNMDQLYKAINELGFPCTLVEGLTREEEKRIGVEPGLYTEDSWISVEDSLPGHDQEVMTYMGDMPESMPEFHKMCTTRYTKEIEVNLEGEKVGEREYFYGGSPDGYQVTHWMPIIARPTKKEDI